MDFQAVNTLPEPTGTYNQTTGQDQYIAIPTYGERTVFLPMVNRLAQQVRIAAFDGLLWINK